MVMRHVRIYFNISYNISITDHRWYRARTSSRFFPAQAYWFSRKSFRYFIQGYWKLLYLQPDSVQLVKERSESDIVTLAGGVDFYPFLSIYNMELLFDLSICNKCLPQLLPRTVNTFDAVMSDQFVPGVFHIEFNFGACEELYQRGSTLKGLEFHLWPCWKGKDTFILQSALPLDNLKVNGELLKGAKVRPWAREVMASQACNHKLT